MAVKKKTKSSASATKPARKTLKPEIAPKKLAAKTKAPTSKTADSTAKPTAAAKKRAAAVKKAPATIKAPAAKSKKRTAKTEPESAYKAGGPVLDPIGDETNGEGRAYLGEAGPAAGQPAATGREPRAEQAQDEIDAFLKETHIEASDADYAGGPGMQAARTATEARARQEAEHRAQGGTVETKPDGDEEQDAEFGAARHDPARAPVKLERLQKILSQAGIASRRTAEEMIAAGRVMVNGQVVTALGSKADAARDHIRVDGKLLHGAERHRYFVLNKPRGYVTTMSDPEGRPTVMEFFAGARERVYPVGRLDFQSEGLLLMTNDGELANLLTKAGQGVEKTYLVKVAGQPTAEQLDRLRSGVAIEKGEQGSQRVRTAPARIQQVREGDNPWFEVVLIEGRNRELRKMFGAIGHFAEKIRRVGYGPLLLDVEPGKMRELTAEEVEALRLTAQGKMKPRRVKGTQMLPKEAGVPAEQRAEKRGGQFARNRGGREFAPRPGKFFAAPRSRPGPGDRRGERPAARDDKPRWQPEQHGAKTERGRAWQPRGEEHGGERKGRTEFRSEPQGRREFRGARPFTGAKPGFADRRREPFKPRGERSEFRGGPKREFGSGPVRERGEKRFEGAARPPFKPQGERPGWKRDSEAKPRREFAPRGEFKPRSGGQRDGDLSKTGNFGGGKAKPAFGRKPGFGSKPGGFGKFRGKSEGGAKRGFSRPGSQRGGWKRG